MFLLHYHALPNLPLALLFSPHGVFMALDLNSLLLGLAAAALPSLALLWHLQRRTAARQAESALLDERLSMAQMAQEGLNAQLDACRDEVSDLSQPTRPSRLILLRCAARSSCCARKR